MITPRDQISHDLSYFSGPRTSGAVEREGHLQSIDISMAPLTHQHSRVCSRASGGCP